MTARRKAGSAPDDPPPDDPFGWWELGPALLARHLVATRAEDEDPGSLAEADALAQRASGRFTELLEDGTNPLAQVASSCELDELSAAVLALLAACELDADALRIATTLSARQLHRPTASLLLELFGPDGLRALAPGGALERAGLIEVENGVALVASAVAVPRPVIWRLLDEAPDPGERPADVRLLRCPPELLGRAARVLVHGEDSVRRTQAAITATVGLLFYVGPPPVDESDWRALTRAAGLDGAGIVLELDGPPTAMLRRWVTACPHLSWALCAREPVDLGRLTDEDWLDVSAAPPSISPEEWSAVFPGEAAPSRLPSAGLLHSARVVARSGLPPADAIRRAASGTLHKHAHRVVPQAGWDDLILPPAQQRRLRDLIGRYRNRHIVHEEWHVPLYPSPGVVALFSGPSGTGKTTTAEVIAHDLGVDLFRVDLSALVSKYIGETEKNLEEIFSAAHAGDYLLLFDEADSLFGTRSKVTDARDRYANMEVSYLLQRLETYDGFVVLTSNFQGNIDTAFLRRIHVTVHFAIPSAAERQRIWERSLASAPREDLDLAFVAEKFDLAGGSIRNCAVTAVFFAAARGSAVGMLDVLRAVSEEFTKLGRRPSEDQFGRWYAAVAAVDGVGP